MIRDNNSGSNGQQGKSTGGAICGQNEAKLEICHQSDWSRNFQLKTAASSSKSLKGGRLIMRSLFLGDPCSADRVHVDDIRDSPRNRTVLTR